MAIAFVLPFTLAEFVDSRFRWRATPNEGAESRFVLLLRSFQLMFNHTDLHSFVIVSPAHECKRVEMLLRQVSDDRRYIVVAQDELYPGIDLASSRDRVGGWHVQQMVKIVISRLLSTCLYVTLDSDVVCTRPFSIDDLAVETGRGRPVALVNVETEGDYRRIYLHSFVRTEMQIKGARYHESAMLLGYARSPQYNNQFYGETPCVLHTAQMAAMLDHLEHRHGKAWHDILTESYGWTEYGLYFQFLESRGLLEQLCCLSDCNRVLDLERSVWQETRMYRAKRPYNEWHFRLVNDRARRGPFVAIQSWLPIESWLPTKHSTIEAFYDEVLSWVIEESLIGGNTAVHQLPCS